MTQVIDHTHASIKTSIPKQLEDGMIFKKGDSFYILARVRYHLESEQKEIHTLVGFDGNRYTEPTDLYNVRNKLINNAFRYVENARIIIEGEIL